MKKAITITIASFLALGGLYALHVGFVGYNTPKMTGKQGKKITIRFKGKDIVVDVQDMHNKKFQMQLSNKWSLKPLYSNESDKENSLAGLRLEDEKGVGHGNFYF